MDTLPDAFPGMIDISQCEVISCEDVALELPPLSPDKKFLSHLDEQLSLMENHRERFRVALGSVEPLSHETFQSLLDGFLEQGKALIIAVVLERDVDDPSVIRAFFFAAGMLNKLVLKKSGEDNFISRHSGAGQLVVNNPLTNLPIVGEIEYYLCDSHTRGYFIGTDYTLWKRSSLRDLFQTHSQLDLDRYESSHDSVHLNDLDASSLEALSRLIDIHRATVLSVIRIPFRKAVSYGVIATIMLLIYAAGFALAMSDYIQLKMGWKGDMTPQAVAILPLVAATSSLFDWWTCSMFNQSESPSFFRSKVLTWLLLVLLTPLIYFAIEVKEAKLMFLSAVMGYCAYHFLYSICLFLANFKHQRPE